LCVVVCNGEDGVELSGEVSGEFSGGYFGTCFVTNSNHWQKKPRAKLAAGTDPSMKWLF